METWFMGVVMLHLSYIAIILIDIRKELEIKAAYDSRGRT